jgi:adenylate cyclase
MMKGKWRPTLRQVFAVSLLGLVLALGGLLGLGSSGSKRTILRGAENYRELAARFIASRVTDYLDQAPAAVHDFERKAQYGLIDFKDTASVQRALLALLLANDNLSEATLTYAGTIGPANHGNAKIDPATAGQIALVRADRPGGFVRRLTWYEDGKFVAASDILMPDSPARPMHSSVVPDPTQHLTFLTAFHDDYGQIITTDLHWAQLDVGLPESQRRVEVSVQKTIEDGQGHFAGVLRIGLLADKVDDAVEQHITGPGQPDQHLIFLCDQQGRLITGFPGHEHVTVDGDDLRIPTAGVPAPVARALQEPVLASIDDDHPKAATMFALLGKDYLCTFQDLPQTQGWIIGIVVPRDFYLGEIVEASWRIFWMGLLVVGVIIVGGIVVLRGVARAQAVVRQETSRMNRFEFSPSLHETPLRDVQDILGGLEKAKTAMRAMSKYVPVKLVRQLYRDGEEPMLGACPAELSVLFTDIRDFTAIAEQMPPARLAEVLGRYLQVMATVIQGEKGTIDKYIGDSVMVFWNAPEPVEHHEILACRTALRCCEALRKLYAMPDWGDAPRFDTRFGLHRCQASVGHFGSPERFNYTAIGDGINLTSRLEGLNKHYGTSIIASEVIEAAARRDFEFRRLDCVAVKGKMQGITIFELLGPRLDGAARSIIVERYEQAFALYQRGAFSDAAHLLTAQPGDDPPSDVLLARCREYAAHPPPNWNGVYAFTAK